MSKARIGAQILLGVAFVFFGLNGFFHFFAPPPPQGDAGTFLQGMIAAKYILPVISVVEVAAGLMLLSNRLVPLALILLAPILVNILGFHLVLDLPGIGAGAVLTGLELFLAYAYRDVYRSLFIAKPLSTAMVGHAASAT